MRILVVEDERPLASTLADILGREHYLVDLAHDGEHGLDCALSGIYDAAILDVMMPRLSGFEVVRRLRQAGSSLPVILLTARSETADKVTGLDAGADYYLTKPFARDELLACLRAVLRRPGEVASRALSFADLELDEESGLLRCQTHQVQLGVKEHQLMQLLMAAGGSVVPRETLFLKVWGYDAEVEGNVVEVYLSFLRKKLRFLNSRAQIAAIRGLGYHLVEGST